MIKYKYSNMTEEPDWMLYEEQVIHAYVLKNKGNMVWPWRFIPEDELHNCGFIHDFSKYRDEKRRLKAKGKTVRQEYGLDGLAIDEYGCYIGIQAKCWDKNKLTASDLGSFLSVIYQRLVRKNKNNKGIVYHTGGIQIYLKEDCLNSGGIITMIHMHLQKEIEPYMDETKYTLNSDQEEARQCLNNCGWLNPIGELNMPPGSGKTLVFSNHIRDINYKNIIILSPLQAQAEQTLRRVRPFVASHKALKIDCEGNGTRDVNEIKEALKNETLCSSTYDSVDVLLEAIDSDMEDDCILIIDEAHNIIGNKDIVTLMDKFKRVLLVSGTPPNSYTAEEDEKQHETIYQLSFKTAIEKGYITNYMVYLPTINKTGNSFVIEDMKDMEFGNQATFLTTGMLRTGSKRCLVYCKSIEECDKFKKALIKIFDDFHSENAELFTLTYKTTTKERDRILKEFSKDDESIKFIMCVNILNEGIDLPMCDSIFIDDIAVNVSDRGHMRGVQRLCRAVRNNKKNPYKIANAFIYTHDRSRLDELFSLLKENDPEFHLRVKCILSDYNVAGNAETKQEEQEQTNSVKKNIITGIETSDQRWMCKYELLKEYVEENKKLPATSYKELGIVDWLNVQKQSVKKDKIIQARKDLLMKLQPFKEWYEDDQTKQKKGWNELYELLKKYVDENDKFPLRSHKDLGKWIKSQKTKITRETITQERKDLLMKLRPFNEWTIKILDEQWNEKYELLKTYTDENNKLPLNRDTVIGNWFSIQKQSVKKDKIIQARKDLLMKLTPFKEWYEDDQKKERKILDEQWNEKYELVKKYVDENNKLPAASYKELGIGHWLNAQKQKVKNNKIIQARKDLLMKLQPFKEWYEDDQTKERKIKREWNEIYELLKTYIEKNNKLPSISHKELGIVKWLSHQKEYVKKETITQERKDLLMKLTPFKEWYEDDQTKEKKERKIKREWNEIYELLKTYTDENNKLPATSYKELGIVDWLNVQKQSVKKDKIIQARKDLLMKLTPFKEWYDNL